MSTLSVTTVTTGLSTTDLTLNTANTGAGDIVIQSDGLGMVLSGNSTSNTVDIAPNGHIAISNGTVNTFVLTSDGRITVSNSIIASTDTIVALIANTTGASISYLGLTNSLHSWQVRNHANGTFSLRDGTASLDRIQISDTTGAVTVLSNTIALGTSTVAASGYTYLPNGLKMNWGSIAANNSTQGNATFASAYTTACYVATVTGANSLANSTWSAGVNTTVVQCRSGNATATGALTYFVAIGV